MVDVGHTDWKSFLRAFPLAVIDVAATFAAFAVAAWATLVPFYVFDNPNSFGYIAFFAFANVVVYALARMYSYLWEFASVDEALRLLVASIVGAVVGDVLGYLLFGVRYPLRVYAVAWMIYFAISASARFAVRVWSGRKSWSVLGASVSGLPRTLVVGAGETGSVVVKRMLACDPAMIGCPVALVDDDSAKLGRYIHGVRVMGGCSSIPELSRLLRVEQIVIATPSADKGQRDLILAFCMKAGLKVLTMPGIRDIPAGGGLGKVALREVEVSDLLVRDEIDLNVGQTGYVRDRCVLVTGGGGSIGSELVRQLLPARPRKIVILDIYENTAYELLHEVRTSASDFGVEVEVEIGSITHMPALERCFADHRPQVVFHAAAHKHVPLMEGAPREAIENNVFGTLNVASLARDYKCSHFILISTDKAVNPTNVMGATKRMCEMLIQSMAAGSNTIFAAVRFGNVLGSHGSVIPLFRRQLREGGPITVTHRDITRYFMTIPEASKLVIAAGALATGGEIFILNMGEPVRIWDLAENLVRLSGLTPHVDIQIVETGLRPGEKMYEELLMEEDCPLSTSNPDITVSRAKAPSEAETKQKLKDLEGCLGRGEREIKLALAEAVPTYCPLLDGE